VVGVERDGLYHGKAVDIIAVPAPDDPRPGMSGIRTYAPFKIDPLVEREMRISFDEAVRLVQVRRRTTKSPPIDVSLSNKYEPESGVALG
jgi:hypothetical protein